MLTSDRLLPYYGPSSFCNFDLKKQFLTRRARLLEIESGDNLKICDIVVLQ